MNLGPEHGGVVSPLVYLQDKQYSVRRSGLGVGVLKMGVLFLPAKTVNHGSSECAAAAEQQVVLDSRKGGSSPVLLKPIGILPGQRN